jgi:hypothetical protein
MSVSAEEAFNIIQKIAASHNIEDEIETIEHRPDYSDYRLTLIPPGFKTEDELSLEGKLHCEIREKLVDQLKKDPAHGDSIKEVAFRLKHPVEYTEFD